MGRVYLMEKVPCERCKKVFTIFYKRKICLCKRCKRNRTLQGRLLVLEKSFKEISTYNKYLFGLYLKYICRFQLRENHLPQAEKIKSLLEEKDFPPFNNWLQIYQESKIYKSTYGRPRNSGCPFIKIGHMLEELGVIPPKQEEMGLYFERLFAKLSANSLIKIKPFIDYKQTTKNSPVTVVRALEILVEFDLWMSTVLKSNLLLADSLLVQKYLDHLIASGCKYPSIVQIFVYLKIYYRWCKTQKMIINNPCDDIKLSAIPPRISICSDYQCEKLFAFIKNQNSDSELALILTLVLIWGLKSEDLRFAKFDIEGDSFNITLRRKQLTGKRRFYYREQVLKLPSTPKWVHQLQKRFYDDWLKRYGQLKKTYPHHYLMLHRKWFVRPLTKSTVLARVYEGTMAAVGERIPAQVLRKTCGHLHSIKSDASILSRLGWSSECSFDYTWTPRSYFSRSK